MSYVIVLLTFFYHAGLISLCEATDQCSGQLLNIWKHETTGCFLTRHLPAVFKVFKPERDLLLSVTSLFSCRHSRHDVKLKTGPTESFSIKPSTCLWFSEMCSISRISVGVSANMLIKSEVICFSLDSNTSRWVWGKDPAYDLQDRMLPSSLFICKSDDRVSLNMFNNHIKPFRSPASKSWHTIISVWS